MRKLGKLEKNVSGQIAPQASSQMRHWRINVPRSVLKGALVGGRNGLKPRLVVLPDYLFLACSHANPTQHKGFEIFQGWARKKIWPHTRWQQHTQGLLGNTWTSMHAGEVPGSMTFWRGYGMEITTQKGRRARELSLERGEVVSEETYMSSWCHSAASWGSLA